MTPPIPHHHDPVLAEVMHRAELLGVRTAHVSGAGVSAGCARRGPGLLCISPPSGEDSIEFEGSPDVLRVLESMHSDLSMLVQHDADNGVFTREIDEAYETLSLLYRVGGSLGDFTKPSAFIEHSLRDLRLTTSLRWVSLALEDSVSVLHKLAGRRWVLAEGDPEAAEAEVIAKLPETEGMLGAAILREPNEFVACPVLVRSERVGVLIASGDRASTHINRPDLTSADMQASEAVARMISAVLESFRLHKEHQATFMGALTALTATLEAKDPYTQGHSERVALMARMLSEATGRCVPERVELAGRLHDVGKIAIPDRILCKPAKLTDEEFAVIRQHPGKGHEILRSIPDLEDVLPGVLHHHERWDGRGYPSGLEGEAIDDFSRMLALADTFDAMSSNRAYRSARTRDEVLAEIRRSGGSQFDPSLTEAFLSLDFARYDELKAEHERSDLGSQRIEDAA